MLSRALATSATTAEQEETATAESDQSDQIEETAETEIPGAARDHPIIAHPAANLEM